MAQLDRLLAVLVSRRGDSLRLVQDEPALMVTGTESQALTRAPLTPAQVLTIVREVAPADTATRIERGEDVTGPHAVAGSHSHAGNRRDDSTR